METHRLKPQQSRLRPVRRSDRCHPRRLQDRPALRRVRPPQAPHFQLCRRPHLRNRLEKPRWTPDRHVLVRRPNPNLRRPGWHRLPLQHQRGARRAERVHGERVLRGERGGVRVLGERRRLRDGGE